MIDLKDVLLTDILPDNLQSDEWKAYAYADQKMREKILWFVERIQIYKNLDKQPDEVLDLLAAENKAQYYSDSLDKETKVALVKSIIRWHQLAGTTEAIQELVSNVFGKAKVSEWFEYGGDPYMLKIESETPYTKEILDLFNNLVKKVKPTVATIEEIKTVSSAYAAPDIMSGSKQMIYNEMEVQ